MNLKCNGGYDGMLIVTIKKGTKYCFEPLIKVIDILYNANPSF
jgi:hypothetical protein